MLHKTGVDGALTCDVDATSNVLCANSTDTCSPFIQNCVVHESPTEAREVFPGIVLCRD
jgi:hypothetical protein